MFKIIKNMPLAKHAEISICGKHVVSKMNFNWHIFKFSIFEGKSSLIDFRTSDVKFRLKEKLWYLSSIYVIDLIENKLVVTRIA